MKRILLSLVLVAGILVTTGAGSTSGVGQQGLVQLSLIDGHGQPMANASWRIYLFPFNAPYSFNPAVLASGLASGNGTATASMNLAPVSSMQAAQPGSGSQFNAIITVVDARHQWRGVQFAVLSTTTPSALVVHADENLASRPGMARWTTAELLQMGPIRSGPDCPGCQPDITRFPDVFTVSSAEGLNTHIFFGFSSSNSHQTITSITASVDNISWSLGGNQVEVQSRGSSQGPLEFDGSFHYYFTAAYDFREYANCIPGHGCTAWWWEPQYWEGAVIQQNHYTPDILTQYLLLFQGPYTRNKGQDWTFSNSFSIEGVGNTDMAQYGDITYEDYHYDTAYSTCPSPQSNYIGGNDNYWSVAGKVYTVCM